MRSLVCVGSLVVAAVVATACGDSNGPTIIYPAIGGTYSGNITYEMTGDPTYGTVVPGIAIQMNDPDGNGNFSGSFQFNTGFTETGTVLGQFSSDGSSILWEQFGDSGQPLFFVGAFLAQAYATCNFHGAVFNLNSNGGFDNAGNLDLNGTYTGIRCGIDNVGDSDTTQLGVSLVSNNPNPFQRVAKPLSLRSLLRGSVQRVK
jgi:hypothetical protein